MNNPQTTPLALSRSKTKRDCLSLILFAALMVWIVSISYLQHTINIIASIEPGLATHITALVGSGIQFGLVIFPLLPLAIFWPRQRYRGVWQTWLLATFYGLFLLPGQFVGITAAQTQAVLHILFTAIFCVFILFIARIQEKNRIARLEPATTPSIETQNSTPYSQSKLWSIALLISSLSVYPWIIQGALGSPLDTVLQIGFGLVFGLAAALLMIHSLFRQLSPLSGNILGSFWMGGLAAGTTLLLMASATGFYFGGMQLLLMLILPGLGWSLAGLHLIYTHRVYNRSSRWQQVKHILPVAALIGLVAAAPMALIDPDELVLILNAESGEILGHAWKAAYLSIGIELVFGLIIFLALLVQKTRSLQSAASASFRKASSMLLGVAAGASWLIAFLVYFTLGHPGFYGERMFVILESQADVSAASNIEDYNTRRQYVYQALVSHANSSQADLRMTLDRLHIDYTPYYLVNAIEVEGNPLLRLWLLTLPEVDRILDSPSLRPLPKSPSAYNGHESAPSQPQWNLTLIGADRVWEAFDVSGEGIIIGQSDSGVQGDHPELAPTYRGANGDHNYSWYDPWNHTNLPTDIGGHGTHTMGIAIGQTTGVAPGATWYACVNLARNLANPALYLECMQFMLAPFPLDGDPFTGGEPMLGAHVINNSWGCPDLEGCDPETFLPAVRALRSAGIFTVTSAGNDGPGCSTIRDPISLYKEVFSVGAIDQSRNLAGFSSIGPVTADGSGRNKPDIVAPGVDVLSSLPGDSYGFYSGTSMAGPHVVGVVALMWSTNHDLIGNIDRTEQILIQSTQPYRGSMPECPGVNQIPSNAVGYGIVDAYAAVQIALSASENNP